MEVNSHRITREQLIQQLEGGQAFLKIEDLLSEVAFENLGERPSGLPYSFYEQFFHMRVAQFDILDFARNPDYEPMEWPEDYWPLQQAPKTEEDWEELKKAFFKERDEIMNLILDESNGLTKPFEHGDGQTLLREALLVLQHNAYHTGQLAIIFRLLK
ncbi:MAG: DinB family protein [Gracilimonas sp.]|uniref:DinB family protein n=1 Tax=Gracilimonas sp. TaxID=1974203 RepID=UPI00198FBBBD|nr:DinB family protein [Gracilimonas sp.]MBD3615398.1 DinB family protein [Gracilimonas sp.]